MAEAELNLNDLSPQDLAVAAAGIVTALENNAHFPRPNPPLPELDRLVAELSKAEQVFAEHRQRTGAARADRDEVAEKLRRALGEEVAYVQQASGGDAAKILSANLHVEETTTFWPFSSVGTVEELTASKGDQPGEIDLAWDAVAGASGYEVESASDLLGEHWEQCGAAASSRLTIEKLAHRSRLWFRVRAIGQRGAGDWSEPVVKYVG